MLTSTFPNNTMHISFISHADIQKPRFTESEICFFCVFVQISKKTSAKDVHVLLVNVRTSKFTTHTFSGVLLVTRRPAPSSWGLTFVHPEPKYTHPPLWVGTVVKKERKEKKVLARTVESSPAEENTVSCHAAHTTNFSTWLYIQALVEAVGQKQAFRGLILFRDFAGVGDRFAYTSSPIPPTSSIPTLETPTYTPLILSLHTHIYISHTHIHTSLSLTSHIATSMILASHCESVPSDSTDSCSMDSRSLTSREGWRTKNLLLSRVACANVSPLK